jgi:hypothetical protein
MHCTEYQTDTSGYSVNEQRSQLPNHVSSPPDANRSPPHSVTSTMGFFSDNNSTPPSDNRRVRKYAQRSLHKSS